MAKTFNQVYMKSKEKVYSDNATALVVLGAMNSSVGFQKVLAPNGIVDAGATTSEYLIQRMKRYKGVKDVANPNAGTTANDLAVLDSFGTRDWITLGTATGKLKSIGVKTLINDANNAGSDFSIHENDVENQVKEIAIHRKKMFIDELLTNGTKFDIGANGVATATATTAFPDFVKGETKGWDFITSKVRMIMRVDDDFKSIRDQSDIVVVIAPEDADTLSKEIGTVFNQEAPIYGTKFKTGMSVNGSPVIVDYGLTKGEWIVMDREAFAFKAEPATLPIDTTLSITRYVGEAFYDVFTIVDKARLMVFKV